MIKPGGGGSSPFHPQQTLSRGISFLATPMQYVAPAASILLAILTLCANNKTVEGAANKNAPGYHDNIRQKV